MKKYLLVLMFLPLFLVGCEGQRKDTVVLKDDVNISAAMYTQEEQYHLLKKHHPDLYKNLSWKKEKDFIIPGLIQTKTLKNNVVSISEEMDPQGVKIAGDYLVMSAYSHDHQHNSVLYVLDKETGKYIKTIVLEGTPHVGGITYDHLHENLWVTTVNEKAGKERHAQVSAIALKDLENYNFEKSKAPITYKYQVNLGEIPEASFIGYDENRLYVGLFETDRDGIIVSYDIAKDVSLDLDVTSKKTVLNQRTLVEPKRIYTIQRKIQGIAFYEDKIILSQSYGRRDSKLLIYDDPEKNNLIDLADEPVKEIEMPPYLEQITGHKGKLYLIFESATKKYRHEKGYVHVDRVLELKKEDIIKN